MVAEDRVRPRHVENVGEQALTFVRSTRHGSIDHPAARSTPSNISGNAAVRRIADDDRDPLLQLHGTSAFLFGSQHLGVSEQFGGTGLLQGRLQGIGQDHAGLRDAFVRELAQALGQPEMSDGIWAGQELEGKEVAPEIDCRLLLAGFPSPCKRALDRFVYDGEREGSRSGSRVERNDRGVGETERPTQAIYQQVSRHRGHCADDVDRREIDAGLPTLIGVIDFEEIFVEIEPWVAAPVGAGANPVGLDGAHQRFERAQFNLDGIE